MRGVKLIEREILPVGIPAAHKLVYPAMQLRDSPSEISLPAPGIKSPATGIDPQPTEDTAHFVLNPLVKRRAPRIPPVLTGCAMAPDFLRRLVRADAHLRKFTQQRSRVGIADRLHVCGPDAALFQNLYWLDAPARPWLALDGISVEFHLFNFRQ